MNIKMKKVWLEQVFKRKPLWVRRSKQFEPRASGWSYAFFRHWNCCKRFHIFLLIKRVVFLFLTSYCYCVSHVHKLLPSHKDRKHLLLANIVCLFVCLFGCLWN